MLKCPHPLCTEISTDSQKVLKIWKFCLTEKSHFGSPLPIDLPPNFSPQENFNLAVSFFLGTTMKAIPPAGKLLSAGLPLPPPFPSVAPSTNLPPAWFSFLPNFLHPSPEIWTWGLCCPSQPFPSSFLSSQLRLDFWQDLDCSLILQLPSSDFQFRINCVRLYNSFVQ